MANGDITNTDVQNFLQLNGVGLTLDSETSTKVDSLCTSINADVNLILKNLGIALPISDSDSQEWLKLTKEFGATSLTLELLSAQDTEEENTRAQRFWDRYQSRLADLINSGGNLLEADFQTDPIPNTLPALVGQFDASLRKRFLRFPQHAAAVQFDNEQEIARTRAGWKQAIRGL